MAKPSEHTHDSQGGTTKKVVGTSRDGDQMTETIQSVTTCSCGIKHSHSTTSSTYTVKKK